MPRPVIVSCIFTTIRVRHPAHNTKLSDTVFHCDGWPVIGPYPKVSVRYEVPPASRINSKMWVGRCTGCGYSTQYWAWGATMGRMLEHQWKGCKSYEHS